MVDVRHAEFLRDLADSFRQCRRASLAVAFITRPGLELEDVATAVRTAVEADANLRILLDLSTGNTDPSAVWSLVGLANTHPTVQLRAVLPDGGRVLHSKFYLFDLGADLVLITGSANLSASALTANIEHGFTARGLRDEGIIAEAMRFFDTIWQSPASRPVDDKAARLYEEFCGRRRMLQTRAEKRSRASWRRLETHLRAARPLVLAWPSVEAAYIMGVICARGTFDDATRSIQIRLRFNRGSYPSGQVRVWNTAYPADEVIPTIPVHIADRVCSIIPASVTASGLAITIDLSGHKAMYDVLRNPFQPVSNPAQFRLPRGLARADEDVVTEFVRGFAVASGLVTDGTALPPNPLTGLPGIQTVWLRPQTGNKRLFDELHALIESRLGIPVDTHWREYREPHLKIRCQYFLEIGFGIDWWDALVAAGANYNDIALR